MPRTGPGSARIAGKKPAKDKFTRREWKLIATHRTPLEVQRLVESIPYNRELSGQTCLSFRGVVRLNRAHCLEGALVAATILEQHGYPPLLVSIESQDKLDHVLYLFKEGSRYGSVARSRDVALHGRKAVYRTVRELVMSYFDPYVDLTGRITGYAVASLYEMGGYDWRFSVRNVGAVERLLQEIPHHQIQSSDRRYLTLHRRFLEYHRDHPGKSADYFPRDNWL
ncbi:MAG TPA: hypothetical protein VKM94_03635 [Blastocatellia bacterium]|nr:hypothetical protein [Blastocatellia bacterium]